MKKLLKAVAVVMVLCMALSVSAFAAVDAGSGSATADTADHTVDVTVLNTDAANKQVVLLLVEAGADLADLAETEIMFIDQKEADADGKATFEYIKVLDPKAKVDIYAGSEGFGSAKCLAEDIELTVKTITLATGANAIITAESQSANGKMPGFGAAITVNIPEGLAVEKMIWGFKLSNENFRRYSKSQEVTSPGTGSVQFAAAFNLGFEVTATVEEVSAIFLTTDGRDHYTDPDDADYKKKD